MRSQLVVVGLALAAMGLFFFALEPVLSVAPPLSLSPSSGPAGTVVAASASGLPAGTRVYLYWYDSPSGNRTFRYVGTATVGGDGGFAGQVSFTVPQTAPGGHNVTLSSAALGPSAAAVPSLEDLGGAPFNVTASAQPQGTAPEPSPLTTWGALSLAAGAVLAAAGFVAKEKEGAPEPPEGYGYCPFCSSFVKKGDARCPECNGVQPRE